MLAEQCKELIYSANSPFGKGISKLKAEPGALKVFFREIEARNDKLADQLPLLTIISISINLLKHLS